MCFSFFGGYLGDFRKTTFFVGGALKTDTHVLMVTFFSQAEEARVEHGKVPCKKRWPGSSANLSLADSPCCVCFCAGDKLLGKVTWAQWCVVLRRGPKGEPLRHVGGGVPKCGRGSKPMVPYFSWDVHRGYGIFTHGHVAKRDRTLPNPLEKDQAPPFRLPLGHRPGSQRDSSAPERAAPRPVLSMAQIFSCF